MRVYACSAAGAAAPARRRRRARLTAPIPFAARCEHARPLHRRHPAQPRQRRLARALNDIALPDAWLVAGCLFQTVWNLRSGLAPDARIKDYDLFYFDADDLSREAEQRVQARVARVVADLGIVVEAANQARVHLWYEEDFGYPYAPLRCSKDGIDRFLVLSTCVGLRPVGDGGHELYAPNGLQTLYDGLLAPNPLTDHRPLFDAKTASYRARWPWLRVVAGGLDDPLRRAAAAGSP